MNAYVPRKGSKTELAIQMLDEGPMKIGPLAEALELRLSDIDVYLKSALKAGVVVKSTVGGVAQYARGDGIPKRNAVDGEDDDDNVQPRNGPASPSTDAVASANPFAAISLDLDSGAPAAKPKDSIRIPKFTSRSLGHKRDADHEVILPLREDENGVHIDAGSALPSDVKKPSRFALFSDGELLIDLQDRSILLDPASATALRHYLNRFIDQ